MAIVVDTGNASKSSSGGATGLTFANTVASGASLLLVYCIHGATGDTITATFNGVSMTSGGMITSLNGRDCQVFYLVNPASGTHNVVLGTSSSVAWNAVAFSVSGSNTTTPLGTVSASGTWANTPNSPYSNPITTAGTSSIVTMGAFYDRDISGLSASDSLILLATDVSLNIGTSYKSAPTAGSYTLTFTGSTATNFGSILVEVNIAPSTTDYTLVCDEISYALTLENVGLSLGHTLALDSISYALTLENVGLTSSRSFVLDEISYSLTLEDVVLTVGVAPWRFANLPGVVYDPDDHVTIYAERLNDILDRLDALES